MLLLLRAPVTIALFHGRHVLLCGHFKISICILFFARLAAAGRRERKGERGTAVLCDQIFRANSCRSYLSHSPAAFYSFHFFCVYCRRRHSADMESINIVKTASSSFRARFLLCVRGSARMRCSNVRDNSANELGSLFTFVPPFNPE